MATPNPQVPDFKPTEVVTQPVRLVFPHLFEPKPAGPFSDGETYEAGMLLPPDFQSPLQAVRRLRQRLGRVAPAYVQGR